jgi:hypothetical protein
VAQEVVANEKLLMPEQKQTAPASLESPLFSSLPLLSSELDAIQLESRALGLKPWMVSFMRNMPELPPDVCSNARPQEAATTHLVWDVEPDFEKKQLIGNATYSYVNKVPGNERLILDVSQLDIEKVAVNGEAVDYVVEKSGSSNRPDALVIHIPSRPGLGEVSIRYRSSESASGVFWVDKEYTEGKQHPLVYTLFEPIEGASAIPGQHSPQVRLTYEINVKTGRPELMALSSVSNNPKERNERGEYSGLRMGRAVPLYLLSLHVGNFSFRSYDADKRTGVYAEDAMVERVENGFRDLPRFMSAAEEICGPYNWGTYTPILLCNAFPYMAMEHPCASTCGAVCLERPTVIPHELAHSWAGNDTTNCNWQQFFWNEGTTTFIEYLITEKIWGSDYASMEFLYTLNDAKATMEEYRKTNIDLLRLCQEGTETRFSRIPYAKGALFFFMLRNAIGENDFGQFFKDYMKVFFQNTMSEERFLAFLQLWLKNEKGIDDFEAFKAEHKIGEWLHGTDIPSNEPQFHSKLMDALVLQKEKVLVGEPVDADFIRSLDIPTQIVFLSLVAASATKEQFALLDGQMRFTESKSMSIRGECSRLCSRIGYLTPETKEMIVSYVLERNSLFEAGKIGSALKQTEEGKELIRMILERDRGQLFPVTRKELEVHLK